MVAARQQDNKQNEHDHKQAPHLAPCVGEAGAGTSTAHNRCDVWKRTFPRRLITSGIIKKYLLFIQMGLFVLRLCFME